VLFWSGKEKLPVQTRCVQSPLFQSGNPYPSVSEFCVPPAMTNSTWQTRGTAFVLPTYSASERTGAAVGIDGKKTYSLMIDEAHWSAVGPF
jgi:hypothetical protein